MGNLTVTWKNRTALVEAGLIVNKPSQRKTTRPNTADEGVAEVRELSQLLTGGGWVMVERVKQGRNQGGISLSPLVVFFGIVQVPSCSNLEAGNSKNSFVIPKTGAVNRLGLRVHLPSRDQDLLNHQKVAFLGGNPKGSADIALPS